MVGVEMLIYENGSCVFKYNHNNKFLISFPYVQNLISQTWKKIVFFYVCCLYLLLLRRLLRLPLSSLRHCSCHMVQLHKDLYVERET